jgi:hypothetical protein
MLPIDRPTTTGRRQGIFWLATVPHYGFVPYLPEPCCWIKGQLELGEGGFLHWQFLVAFTKKSSLSVCRALFGSYHFELSRSEAAELYVWKEDTAVLGTKFELGRKPFQRNSKTDWEQVWLDAQKGDLLSIPASIRVQSYRTLRQIGTDFALPDAILRECFVYWGTTGTGKSRLAWEQAGLGGYPKDPRSKFWCGYRNQPHVVIDEFRGGIDIGHMLRWLDRYPVIVEVKGGAVCLQATKIWITSNLSPDDWFPEADPVTKDALMRRLTVTHFVTL